MPTTQDMTGRKFGTRTVIRRVGLTKKGQTLWLMRDRAGQEFVRRIDKLAAEPRLGPRRTNGNHGMCGTTEYAIWRGIIARCTNPKNPAFKYYGARGISVCPAWLEAFENFFADMGRRPTGRSIDRIDNDGNYEPNNCRWATPKEQVANQRRRQHNGRLS